MPSNIIIFLLLFLVSCQKNTTFQISVVTICCLVLFVSLFIVALVLNRFRVSRIHKIYKATKSQLHFWDKLERQRLESFLIAHELPNNWVFSFNKEKTKIESIYFYNGLEVRRIAQDKELLYESLRKRLNKN